MEYWGSFYVTGRFDFFSKNYDDYYEVCELFKQMSYNTSSLACATISQEA